MFFTLFQCWSTPGVISVCAHCCPGFHGACLNLCRVDLHFTYDYRVGGAQAVEIVVTEGLLLELGDATTVEMMAIGLVTARLGTGETSAIDVVNGVTLSAIATIVPSLQAGLTCFYLQTCHIHDRDCTHYFLLGILCSRSRFTQLFIQCCKLCRSLLFHMHGKHARRGLAVK